MNIDSMKKLREWLASGAAHITFDMGVGIKVETYKPDQAIPNDCGTACCLAGAATLLAKDFLILNQEVDDEIDWTYVKDSAQEWLDLTDDQAYKLFRADLTRDWTLAQGIQAIDNLMADPDCNPWKNV